MKTANIRRKNSAHPKGAIWVMTVLFLFIILIFAAVGVDYGNALAIKQQAIAITESAAHAGWIDNSQGDYYNTGPIPATQWEDESVSLGGASLRPNVARATVSRFPRDPDDFPTDAADEQNPPYNSAYPEGQTLSAGARIRLYDAEGNEIDPNDEEGAMIVHVGDAKAGTPEAEKSVDYIPDIQENNQNLEHGDIVFGNWAENTATGNFTFTPNTILPNCMRVYVRRTYEPKITDVREGENPIHFLLGRAVGGYFAKEEDTPAQIRNRGIRLQVRSTVVMVPAGHFAKGKVVERPRDTRQDGTGTSYRFGLFPLAIKFSAVQALLTTVPQNPATTVTITVQTSTSGSTNGFFTTLYNYTTAGPSYDGTNFETQLNFTRSNIRFLNGMTVSPPEDLALRTPPGLSVGGQVRLCEGLTNAQVTSLLNDVNAPASGTPLTTTIFTVPIVQTAADPTVTGPTTGLVFRCVGFMKMYCESCNPAARTITFRMAPSSVNNLTSVMSDAMNLTTQTGDSTTNPISYPDMPTLSVNEIALRAQIRTTFYNNFWIKTTNAKYNSASYPTGVPYIAPRYGVACSSATSRYHNVTEDVNESQHPEF